MQDQHTPGPWSYDGSHIYAPDGEIIAQVHNPGRVASDYPLEANRNLMAAAPELLAALRAALPRLAHLGCGYVRPASEWAEHGSMSFDNCACEIATVKAAIAKATEPA